MEYKRFSDVCVIRLDRGDEAVACLMEVVRREGVTLGAVSGIGAADLAVVGLYDVGAKEYHKTELSGPMEITSLVGNVTTKDGAPYLHLHINLCDASMNVRGGHLNECRISATGEIVLTVLDGRVERRQDPDTGLNLFRFL